MRRHKLGLQITGVSTLDVLDARNPEAVNEEGSAPPEVVPQEGSPPYFSPGFQCLLATSGSPSHGDAFL